MVWSVGISCWIGKKVSQKKGGEKRNGDGKYNIIGNWREEGRQKYILLSYENYVLDSKIF